MKNALRIPTRLAAGGTLIALFFVTSLGIGSTAAHAEITSLMGVGSRGSDVTQLQQFLASNSWIYPAGTVSGYFGSLTRAAVVQFQTAYDIDQVGNVGPITKAKINSIMNSGFGLDTTVPVISNLAVSVGSNSASVLWTTSESARGQVFYDTQPIRANEQTANSQIPYVSGTLAENTGYQTSQAINLSNLQTNTTYYYIVRSIDRSGNITMTLSNSFHTGS